MGVSLYYTAYRDRELSPGERTEVEALADQGTSELMGELRTRMPGWRRQSVIPADMVDSEELCEGLAFYPSSTLESGVVLRGASRVSHAETGVEPMRLRIEFYLRLLARIRAVVPDAQWHVHLDDVDLVWNEETREYDFPAE